nr:hypothetical protein DA06_03145 [Georgenia sp. SUBG003]
MRTSSPGDGWEVVAVVPSAICAASAEEPTESSRRSSPSTTTCNGTTVTPRPAATSGGRLAVESVTTATPVMAPTLGPAPEPASVAPAAGGPPVVTRAGRRCR